MECGDAPVVGRLYRQAIPWAIISKLGTGFAARFLYWLHCQENSRIWVAKDRQGQILGITGSTLDKPKAYGRILREHRLEVAARFLLNLYRPAVLKWLFYTIQERIRSGTTVDRTVPQPAADWLFLALVPQARGSGLADGLFQQIEADLRAWGLKGPYLYLVLKDNIAANKLYQRLGAKFIMQYRSRGHLINEYHKELSPVAE